MACLIPHRNWESLEKPLAASSIPKESMSAAIVKCLRDCVKARDDHCLFANLIYEIVNKINLKKNANTV